MKSLEHSHDNHLHTEGVSIPSVLEHSFLDTLPMIPILILTFIMIEYMEHKFSKGLQEKVRNAGVLGPILGAIIGIIPQCGFSVMAVALYSKKIVSLGTMIAIFIATSDEALPVFLSMPSAYKSIVPFILIKIIIAIVAGYTIDIIVNRRALRRGLRSELACSREVEENVGKCVEVETVSFYKVLLHSLERTLKVTMYIYIVTFIITLIIEYFGVETLTGSLFTQGYGQILLASIIGLIPNCAISVGLVKLFTVNIIGFSSVIAGLSSNAGLALIFLFKESKDKKKALLITFILLGISFVSGVIIQLTGIYS